MQVGKELNLPGTPWATSACCGMNKKYINIAINSIVQQGIYIVIMAIEDKYFGVITNTVF